MVDLLFLLLIWIVVFEERWVIEVVGAPGTLYANETYQLQVDFPEHYPMEAPQVGGVFDCLSCVLVFTFMFGF